MYQFNFVWLQLDAIKSHVEQSDQGLFVCSSEVTAELKVDEESEMTEIEQRPGQSTVHALLQGEGVGLAVQVVLRLSLLHSKLRPRIVQYFVDDFGQNLLIRTFSSDVL